MAQNVYDRPDFFHSYSELGRSVEGLDGAVEWAALRVMLPQHEGTPGRRSRLRFRLVLPMGSSEWGQGGGGRRSVRKDAGPRARYHVGQPNRIRTSGPRTARIAGGALRSRI